MPDSRIKILRGFFSRITQKGHEGLRKSFDIKDKVEKIDAGMIRRVLNDRGFEQNHIYLADHWYYAVNVETIKKINQYDWLKHKEYLDDRYDCDNFATSYTSHLAEIYSLNCAGMAHGVRLTDPEDGSHIGYHRCNVIITKSLTPYLYEPMNNGITELEYRGQTLGDWHYIMNGHLTFG